MAKKGEKQSPEYIAKRMASFKETRRKKGLPVSDDLGEPPLCACGCGQKVHKHPEKAHWYKYINGHNRRGCTNGEKQRLATSIARKGKPLNLSEEDEQIRRIKISNYQKGRIKSEEHRKNLSESLKIKYINDAEYREQRKEVAKIAALANKGRPGWSKGLTKETHPSIMSLSLKLIERFKDKNNCPNWMGGISYAPYPIEFNSQLKHRIKTRDNYTCRECNKKVHNRDLHVHHIDYNKMNNNDSNLITLCNSCHAKTIRGKNRNFYRMYYNYKMKKEINYLINKFSQLEII